MGGIARVIHRYTTVGRELIDGQWGFDVSDNRTRTEVIGNLTERQVERSLLAYACQTLRQLADRSAAPRDVQQAVSDGCVKWLRASAEVRVASLDTSGLSPRAQRALLYIEYLSEVTQWRLRSMRGVGSATASEILEWRDRVTNDRKRTTDGE